MTSSIKRVKLNAAQLRELTIDFSRAVKQDESPSFILMPKVLDTGFDRQTAALDFRHASKFEAAATQKRLDDFLSERTRKGLPVPISDQILWPSRTAEHETPKKKRKASHS